LVTAPFEADETKLNSGYYLVGIAKKIAEEKPPGIWMASRRWRRRRSSSKEWGASGPHAGSEPPLPSDDDKTPRQTC